MPPFNPNYIYGTDKIEVVHSSGCIYSKCRRYGIGLLYLEDTDVGVVLDINEEKREINRVEIFPDCILNFPELFEKKLEFIKKSKFNLIYQIDSTNIIKYNQLVFISSRTIYDFGSKLMYEKLVYEGVTFDYLSKIIEKV